MYIYVCVCLCVCVCVCVCVADNVKIKAYLLYVCFKMVTLKSVVSR